jgi:hypothetical protein
MMKGSYNLFQAPYRDPKTKLRYHDLGVYNYIQNLASGNQVTNFHFQIDLMP